MVLSDSEIEGLANAYMNRSNDFRSRVSFGDFIECRTVPGVEHVRVDRVVPDLSVDAFEQRNRAIEEIHASTAVYIFEEV